MPVSIFNHRPSNTEIPMHRQRLDVQCEQIFQRASSINKDLIHRMQNVPIAKKHVFGLEIRKIWILLTLSLLFSCSLVGTILLWFTDAVDKLVMKELMIANGTDGYEGWIHPKVKGLMKIHIFNYTNVENFEQGLDKRLRVKDLGPYVYEETIERHNVHFEADGTISFRNIYRHRYLPHLSKGKPNDIVVVPNVMVLTAAYKTRDIDFWARLTTAMTLRSLTNDKPFIKLAANRFIWGYDDSFYDIARGFMAFQRVNMYDQLGLMTMRSGTSQHLMTMNTGQKDMRKYGLIARVNGFSSIGHWPTNECDSLMASDGTLFPPNVVRSKQNLAVYIPDSCRKFPYVFEKEVLLFNNTVPAYRYKMAESVFDSADKEPANMCYCDTSSGICSPQGLYNVSSCQFGAPLFMSLPHFKHVNPSDIRIDGLNTAHMDVTSYANLHPVLGYPITGSTKIQLNAYAKSYSGFYSMDMFGEDGVMLPLGWIESGLEEKDVSREYMDIIYYTTFTIKQIEMVVKYITLLTTLITMSAIIIILKARIQGHKKHTSSNDSSSSSLNNA